MGTYVITIDDDVDPGISAMFRATTECIEPGSSLHTTYANREAVTRDHVQMHQRLGVKVRHIVT